VKGGVDMYTVIYSTGDSRLEIEQYENTEAVSVLLSLRRDGIDAHLFGEEITNIDISEIPVGRELPPSPSRMKPEKATRKERVRIDWEANKELLMSSESNSKIAAKLGCSSQAVYKQRKARGWGLK
jgi:hypothetical protein